MYHVEYTDTFGGEANYSWVRRVRFNAPADAPRSTIVRRAKAALGLTERHTTEEWGDTIVLKFPGTIAFIDWMDSND